ncbi:MAG: OsmC family protein [Vicinamibacterales bacterium]
MSQTTTAAAPRERLPLNGVDTPNLLGTINVVKGQPGLAKFRFRATNQWLRGTHSRTTIESFSGAGGEHTHATTFQYDGDHPAVLVGADQAPTPVEFLLHGLASCITAGIGNIAAVRGVTLTSVEARLEGDIDLRGILGLSDDVRNGYEEIRATFRIAGDAPPETLRAIVEQARARSAVYDVLTSGVPVDIRVETA